MRSASCWRAPHRFRIFLIGTGRDMAAIAPALRQQFRDRNIVVETMATSAAIRTYNVLLDEKRPIAALLIAVE